MNLRLPNGPPEYSREWADQYTRQLEIENQLMWSVLLTLQQFVLPNYTTVEKLQLSNQAGKMVFDTTLGKACINVGTGWETITSV